MSNVHVIPVEDLREHDVSVKCWCKPTPDDEEPWVWVHHSMDKREEYEEGRRTS
jgi:nicotinamide mononucleotide adenylyltransferase